MKIKYIALLFCAILIWSCSNNNSTVIKGHLCRYEGKGFCLLDYDSNEKQRDTIVPDKNGNFHHNVTCSEPVKLYFSLRYLGDNSIYVPIYVTPGTELDIDFEEIKSSFGYPEKDIERYDIVPVFKGTTANECNYLNLPYKEFSYTKEDKTPLTYKEFSDSLSEYRNYLTAILDKCCKDFSVIHTKDLDKMQYQQLFIYGHNVKGLGYDLINDADFMKMLGSINIEDTVNCIGMNSITEGYINMNLSLYPQLYEGDKEIIRFMKYLRDKVSNRDVQEKLSDASVQAMLKFGITDNLAKIFDIYKDLSGSSKIFKNNEKIYNGVKNIMPGMPAPDFKLEDINGNSVSFNDIIGHGKIAYIDFWATWCVPCRAEIPYMEKLAKVFRDNPNIVFISISLDTDRDKWADKIKADNPEWPQYIVSKTGKKEFESVYNIDGIPRFMLIDKNGCFISNNALRPSFDMCENYLRNYLK